MLIFIGIVVSAALAILSMVMFMQDRPNVFVGSVSAFLAIVALLGGFFAQNQQFRSECEALGRHVIGDTCTSSYYVEIDDDYDSDDYEEHDDD